MVAGAGEGIGRIEPKPRTAWSERLSSANVQPGQRLTQSNRSNEHAKQTIQYKTTAYLAPVMMAVGGCVASGVAVAASVGAAAARGTITAISLVLDVALSLRAVLGTRERPARGAATGEDDLGDDLDEFIATDAMRATCADTTMDIVM